MDLLVLDSTVLTMVGRYRLDVFGVKERHQCHAALCLATVCYLAMCQLGIGIRRVITSWCVW